MGFLREHLKMFWISIKVAKWYTFDHCIIVIDYSYLNEFKTITNQLSSVEIDFDDEIRALIVLASLPNSWEAMRMTVSNSARKEKLKYNNIRDLILAEEIRRRDSGETSRSSFALNLETRGRGNDKNSNQGRSKSRNFNRNRSKSILGQQVQC